MADISIGKISTGGQPEKSSKNEGKYSTLKKAYDSFKKETAKSDLANSPVIKQKELALLSEMKEAAQAEGLKEELSFIETQEAEIAKALGNEAQNISSIYYTPINVSTASISAKNEESAKNGTNQTDENASRVSEAFKEYFVNVKEKDEGNNINHIDDKAIAYLLKKCSGLDGTISTEKADILVSAAKAGVHPSMAIQIIEDFTYYTEPDKQSENNEIQEILNTDACHKFLDFKSMGYDDVEALKFAKFLTGSFQDENTVINSINKMSQSKISPDYITDILSALSIEAPDKSGMKKISSNAVESILTLKKTLNKFNKNEKKELENPIKQLGVFQFETDDKIIIMKDKEVTYIQKSEGDRIDELKEEYNQMISRKGDDILLKFAEKYKDKDGEIDRKALRTASSLRKSGVTYEHLLNLTDFCFDKENIDSNKLNTIRSLKNAGCLDSDIIYLLDSCKKTPDGKYDSEDIQNICDLTSSVIAGKEVAELLPEVYNNEEVKDLLMSFSELFPKKSDLGKLIPLIKDKDGNTDDNAISVVYDIAENLYNSDFNISTNKFLQTLNQVLSASKNKNEDIINDESAGICSVMCQNGYSIDEILQGLEACKNKDSNFDESLSELLWQLALKKADMTQITQLINSARNNEDNTINQNLAEKLANDLQKGADVNKLLDELTD